LGTVDVPERLGQWVGGQASVDPYGDEGAGELVAVVVTDERVDHVHQGVGDVGSLDRPAGGMVYSAVAGFEVSKLCL